MAVELTASRFLAPYYGSSMIVWTVLIGIILAAMSVGNFLGGVLSDKEGAADRLYRIILFSGLWVALIPVLGRYVVVGSFPLMMAIFPESLILSGTIFSCLTIFAVPCILLGTVAPALVKIGTKDLVNNGRTAGEIFAVSTFGSIIGTILPTFLFIPYIGTTKTFFLLAFALVLISVIYHWRNGSRNKKAIGLAVLLLIGILAPVKLSYAFWQNNVEEFESVYNYIKVKKTKDGLQLGTHVEVGDQSIYKKNSILTGSYWDYALLAPYLSPDPKIKRVLVLGFAAGTFARQCRFFWPECKIEGVEIDKKIYEIGKQAFETDKSGALVYIDDARTHFERFERGKYDLILLDAFKDVSIPFHLTTLEFFKTLSHHLTEDGTLVINFNMPSDDRDGLLKGLTNTIGKTFPRVWTLSLPNDLNSLIFAGSERHDPQNLMNLESNLLRATELKIVRDKVIDQFAEEKPGKVFFTDDMAPVEYLSQKATDNFVKEGLNRLFVEIILPFRVLF